MHTCVIKEYESELQGTLLKVISEYNRCNLECHKSNNNTIWMCNDSFEIEFRYVILLNRIIVSRISFRDRRRGCMAECFKVIQDFAKKLSLNIIEIQSVETYEMMCWCKKMGFVAKEFNIDVQDDKGRLVSVGDWDFIIE